jgi:ubiquinone/menaquinone biosynthesis C-methylase UbiE
MAYFIDAINARIPGRPHCQLVSLLNDPPGRVLDVCAGTGYTARILARRLSDPIVIAVDKSSKMIAIGERRAASDGITRISFVKADASKLPFDDGEFDAVVSAFGIHELQCAVRTAAIMEAARVLRCGGRLLLADIDEPKRARAIFYTYLRVTHGSHAHEITGNGLRSLAESAGFEIVTHDRNLGTYLPFQLISARLPRS